jgi:hypothetical protein
MGSVIYIEGGGESKYLHSCCRHGFRKLLEKCGYAGHMPRLVAGGGRGTTFNDFKVAFKNKPSDDFIAMLLDSEDPLQDTLGCWAHLKSRDGWNKPDGATEEQVLFMTTCMETWIVADRNSLINYYGTQLFINRLPSLVNLEKRVRHEIQNALEQATVNCSNAYQKNKRSYEVLAILNPDELRKLPNFSRITNILDRYLMN